MKTSKFTDSQIMAILKQAEAGTPVPELCRDHGMSSATFYKWRAKFGGMDASLMARLKELEAENVRLKKCTPKSA
jgi:putative transposase